MAEFKLTINDPKTGKSYKKEVKDNEGDIFLNLTIGDKVKGETFGYPGYEFEITGGSDKCGFPMRSGISAPRKSVMLTKSVGLRKTKKGLTKKKTVCGDKVIGSISQINLKVIKQGPQSLEPKAEAKEETPQPESKKEDVKPAKPDTQG